jgi:hypothetical protein
MKELFLFALIVLTACSTAPPQVTITPEATFTLSSILTATPTISPAPISTFTPSLVPTLNQTQVAINQSTTATQSVFQTEVSEFPRLCPGDTPYFSDRIESFSPDSLWLGELCLSSEYKDLVLTFSNKNTQVVWKMFYHDYIPDVVFADGGMRVVHWPNDGRYVYFYSSLGGSVGECFYEGYDTGEGLFRLDLQTGQTEEILPLINENPVWYGFSFSPTDRWLVYGIRTLDLVILDIMTGESINIAHKKDFSQGGGYLWSPDGSQFEYSTVKYLPNNVGRVGYTLRLVDVKTGVEQILLESKTSCYLAKEWKDNGVLIIEYDDENYNRALMQYDLNSNTIIDAPVSSAP